MEEQTHSGPRALRFHGTYTQPDLDALARFAIAQSLDLRLARATLLAAGLVALLALLTRSWTLAILGFLIVIGLSALARFAILPRFLLRRAPQRQDACGPRTIIIEESVIHHHGPVADASFSIMDIRRAVLTGEHLFLLFRPQGLLMLPLEWVRPVASIEDLALRLARRTP